TPGDLVGGGLPAAERRRDRVAVEIADQGLFRRRLRGHRAGVRIALDRVAVLPHARDRAGGGDVLQRVAVHQQQVGAHARGDVAAIVDAEAPRRQRGGGGQRLRRL